MRVALFSFLVCCFTSLSAQVVSFEGNRVTNSRWLKSVLLSETWDTTGNKDIHRLSTTGLFQEIIRREENNGYTYVMTEKRYWTPIVFVGALNERQPKIILGAQNYNAFGRGVQVSAYYQYFERNSFEVNINANRWFEGRHGPLLFAKGLNTIEPIYLGDVEFDYNYSLNALEVGYSYHWSPFFRTVLAFSPFKETYRARNKDEVEGLLPAFFKISKFTPKAMLQYSTVSNNFHLLDGMLVTLSGEMTFSKDDPTVDEERFDKFNMDVRYYRTIHPKINMATRLIMGIANFNGSPFAAFVKDDLYNIRGIGDRSARGSSEITLNIELRRDVLKKGNYFAQGVIFADVSNVLPSDYRDRSTRSFSTYTDARVGMGLRLGSYFFFNSVIRLDASFDPEKGEFSGFVLGFGQFF